MRYDKAGTVFHQLIHRFLDIELRSGIHAAGCLVEDQNRWISQYGTRNRKKSLLPLRYVRGLLVQNGIVAVRRVRMK